MRAPVVFYNRANEAAAQLKPGDFDWKAIFAEGVRWFHSGGIFASLSSTTGELILEAMQAARKAGAVISFDLNYRAKLWNIWGGQERAVSTLSRIVENVDVLVGNEEDLQLGLGLAGPEVSAKSKLDPAAFLGMIDQVVAKFPQVKVVATTLPRGAFHQSPFLGSGSLDQRAVLRFPHLRAGCLRPGGRRGWFRFRSLLRAPVRRTGTGSRQPGLGAWCIADHLPRRHDHGYSRTGAGVRQGRLSPHPALAKI